MAAKGNKDALQQAGSIWKLLDNMSLSNPAEYKQFVDKVLKDGNDNNMGPPVSKMVIQTEKIPTVIPACKYFINLSEWKQIPPAKSKESPIQIASSDLRKEIIEKEWAFTVDVVVNPTLFQNGTANYIENAALIELVLKFIESKQLINLSRKYKILKDKYKGNQDNLLNFMCPSALKNSISTLVNGEKDNSLFEKVFSNNSSSNNNNNNNSIEEMMPDNIVKNDNDSKDEKESETNNHETSQHHFDPIITVTNNTAAMKESNTKSLKNNNEFKSKLKTPKVEMLLNKEKENVELSIYLPGVKSVQECDLNLTEDNVMLVVDGKYNLDLMLPIDINVDQSNAKFVKDKQVLFINATFVPVKK